MPDLPTLSRNVHEAQAEARHHATECGAEHCLDWRDDLLTAEHHLAEARRLIAHVAEQQAKAAARVPPMLHQYSILEMANA